MSKHTLFLVTFIIAVIAVIIFFVCYINASIGIAFELSDVRQYQLYPGKLLHQLFTPAVIISLIVMIFCNLIYRILGIVWVVQHKVMSDGEKALWIVGFLFLGFITAIVFLIMAKGKQLV